LQLAEEHARLRQLGRLESVANDAHFAAGQRRRRHHRLDVRVAVHVLLAQQVGDTHE